jgi:hypothetical protein
VGGDLDADDTIFAGGLQVCGDFSVRGCCFFEVPVTTAPVACIESSTLPGLIVKSAKGPCFETQLVKISNCSAVDGDICFESGRGKVLIDKSSCFSGCIYGGTLIKQ